MKLTKLLLALLLAGGLSLAYGCDDDDSLDDAADDTADTLDEAADDTGDALDDAADDTEDALDDATDN